MSARKITTALVLATVGFIGLGLATATPSEAGHRHHGIHGLHFKYVGLYGHRHYRNYAYVAAPCGWVWSRRLQEKVWLCAY